jgi:hypothetical protein
MTSQDRRLAALMEHRECTSSLEMLEHVEALLRIPRVAMLQHEPRGLDLALGAYACLEECGEVQFPLCVALLTLAERYEWFWLARAVVEKGKNEKGWGAIHEEPYHRLIQRMGPLYDSIRIVDEVWDVCKLAQGASCLKGEQWKPLMQELQGHILQSGKLSVPMMHLFFMRVCGCIGDEETARSSLSAAPATDRESLMQMFEQMHPVREALEIP